MPEEEKDSRSRSNSRNPNSSTFAKGHKKGNQGGKKKGYDSYSESDEGVSDANAMFQKRDGPLQNQLKGIKKNRHSNNGSLDDEELDHTESDEGVNDRNPNFDGNEFLFAKRGSSNKKSNGKKG